MSTSEKLLAIDLRPKTEEITDQKKEPKSGENQHVHYFNQTYSIRLPETRPKPTKEKCGFETFLGVLIAKALNSATRRTTFGSKTASSNLLRIGPGLLTTCHLFSFQRGSPQSTLQSETSLCCAGAKYDSQGG